MPVIDSKLENDSEPLTGSEPLTAGDTSRCDPPRPVLPGSTIGMLGGGQLGRMFGLAAAQLGYRMVVLGDAEDCPAAPVSVRTLVGSPDSSALLDEFASLCDVATLEFENIPVSTVAYLAPRLKVYPQAAVLRVAQDRVLEKQTLAAAGLPVTPFQPVSSPGDLQNARQSLGLPIVLKTTRDGYDGKGQWKIRSESELREWTEPTTGEATDRFDRPLIAEAWVDYQREVSVLVARGAAPLAAPTDSDPFPVAAYPVFENRHRNHILDVTTCPASIAPTTAERATELAIHAARSLGLFGLMCIEFFIDEQGDLLINEIAPRPHNSGHLTIEACQTSQFEQQLRAVCGLPLGDPALIVPAAAMVNVMGDAWRNGTPDWDAILSIPGAHLHLYDKRSPKLGRKMGHVTLVGQPQVVDAGVLAVRQILQT
ncbi:MAG: 5-(carboxyamino)imidazole ribonucleotide synthase [Planctomycetaceae bacterium]|nr:MAG: 5-(carboxyamino)imidazole ribonucleotide synthase [Planctomycetaceae bacterium]